MKLALAICPACKQQIEVDASAKVDLCKSCGKPFDTNDAIKLYNDEIKFHTESVQPDNNSRKPTQEIIEKFNAILIHDYKLAKKYLDDIVITEYPKLRYHCHGDLFSYGEKEFKNLYSLNPFIADMYYSVFCAQTNAQYKEKYGITLSGALISLKRYLSNFKSDLRYMVSYIERSQYLSATEDVWSKETQFYKYSEERSRCISDAENSWKKLVDSIKKCTNLQGKEFDDEFILFVIDSVERYAVTATYGTCISDFLEPRRSFEMRSLDDLTTSLEGFLSTNGKTVLVTQRRKRKEEAHEARRAQAYEKELAFWQQYISLLKSGQMKEACKHLKTTNNCAEIYKSEISKFKNGFLNVKYIGDINLLHAEELATLALKDFK